MLCMLEDYISTKLQIEYSKFICQLCDVKKIWILSESSILSPKFKFIFLILKYRHFVNSIF